MADECESVDDGQLGSVLSGGEGVDLSVFEPKVIAGRADRTVGCSVLPRAFRRQGALRLMNA